MLKRMTFMLLTLLLAGSLAACTVGGVVDPSLPSAQEIINAVFESMSDMKTYQFQSDMLMSAAGEAGHESFEMNMDMTFAGAVDIENRQMGADILMWMEVPGEGNMDMGMAMYVVDGMAYTKVDFFGEDMWMKSAVTDEVWCEMSQTVDMVESYVGLLEVAQVRVTGIEDVGGVDCYVLEVTPDMDQLWQLAMQQVETTDMGISIPAEGLLSEMFRDFSVKQWVSTETFYVHRIVIEMSMEMTPDAMGLPDEYGTLSMDISMYMLVHDYNQPVSITLPAGAASAIDADTGWW
ncbi:MAG TPA: hypothetical protein G4O18_04965 [Dehalococcoidia bacterium]|nr:hypothetical protein [Dehalococcoidia bacterium]